MSKTDWRQAKWNTRYMVDPFGRALKISQMNMTQVNNSLRQSKTTLTVIQNNMEGLYQRRHTLKHQEGAYEYRRKNTKQKIIQHLKLKTQVDIEGEERYKQILLTALSFLEDGQDIKLIKAILEQARDEE
tara:strand:- start:42 stop:431 length:390 start_codon:yes stop_codon:yes gene_type:complete